MQDIQLFFNYVLQGAINESGLGLLSWWDQQNQQMDDQDDVGEEYEEWNRLFIEIDLAKWGFQFKFLRDKLSQTIRSSYIYC